LFTDHFSGLVEQLVGCVFICVRGNSFQTKRPLTYILVW